jgi:hypothetical protein
MIGLLNSDGTLQLAANDDGYGPEWQRLGPTPDGSSAWRWDGQWRAMPAPVPRLMPDALWQLLTVQEHAALVVAARNDDGLLSVAFDRINARRDPLPLDDTNFIAMVWRAAEIGVLSVPRAAQVMAGIKA